MYLQEQAEKGQTRSVFIMNGAVMKVFVSNATSFIGRNLIENLKNIRDGKNRTRPNISISEISDADADLAVILPGSDVSAVISGLGKATKLIYISGLAGSADENIIRDFDENAFVYRLPEIVGKWQDASDGVIASLCYAIANDEPYTVDRPNEILDILFIDDFLEEMYDAIEGKPHRCNYPMAGERSSDTTADYDGKTRVPQENGNYCYSPKTIKATVSSIVEKLKSFNCLNYTFIIPEIPQGTLDHRLYSMYLSYLPERKMTYPLRMNIDNRGIFTELIKTVNNGQVSINIARPNNIRGQHWHNNKWEIFIVVSGHGLIQERKIGTEEVYNFEVRGEEMRAVIMLPGYAHNIINLEDDKDLVTVMYSNEQFDERYPDTYFEIVEDKF